LSRESLAKKRRDMGAFTYGAQMLLNPTADRKQGFLEDWITYYMGGGDFSRMNKYILVDAAGKKKQDADFTAMGVVGLGDDDNYYLLDGIRDKLSLTERGDALFALHRRWRPRGVGYEQYGLMADVEYYRDRMARENYRFEITELGGRLAKNDRIRRMIPIFEAKRFLLPETLIKVDYQGHHVDLVQSFLNEEYRPFPVGLHDDFFDMLSRICDPEMAVIWPKPTSGGDRYAKARERRPRISGWAA
jgi:phage terminase large subunit-like protein